jgi:hypothetical protein
MTPSLEGSTANSAERDLTTEIAARASSNISGWRWPSEPSLYFTTKQAIPALQRNWA